MWGAHTDRTHLHVYKNTFLFSPLPYYLFVFHTLNILLSLNYKLKWWKNRNIRSSQQEPYKKTHNRTLLTKWKKCNYGFRKIHKQNCPFRIIISSIRSPLYALASYLHNILYEAIPKADSYIKNTFQLVKNLERMKIDDNHKLISFDVISLFTNILIEIALDCINENWNFISKKRNIPKGNFRGSKIYFRFYIFYIWRYIL